MNEAISDCTGGIKQKIYNPLLPYKADRQGVDGKQKENSKMSKQLLNTNGEKLGDITLNEAVLVLSLTFT